MRPRSTWCATSPKKPAGILLAALDSEALIPPVEEAMAAGVPVAMVDSGIDGDVPVASIITDQYKGGFMAGEEMAKLLDKKGTVANLGIQAGSVSAGRSKGFADAIAQYPDMKVLETQWTDADAAKSLNIATDLITGNPDIAGFFSAAAPIAAGIAQAAKAKGIDKKVKIITFDPSPEILPLFDDGTIQAIIAQDPYQMGYQGVAAIDAFMNGKKIETPKIELAPVLITPENVKSAEVQAAAPDAGQVPEVGADRPAPGSVQRLENTPEWRAPSQGRLLRSCVALPLVSPGYAAGGQRRARLLRQPARRLRSHACRRSTSA